MADEAENTQPEDQAEQPETTPDADASAGGDSDAEQADRKSVV